MTDKKNLLRTIQQYDFMLYDLQLYLNTHPSCTAAMQQYRKYKALKQAAEEQYVQLCGPLTAVQSDTETKWNWTENPWPWEKEAN
ncbi:MAG: spore coat protein CotJB [Ruminococcus sp.]|nr:spore coat protein CotJB [Ruminococcus sp.]